MNSNDMLREILKDIFKNSSIPDDISDLKMGDFDEWDSLGNFNLILAVEQKFKIQFDMDDIENMNSVRAILIGISDAVSKK
jgi:acyl carrier protein